MATKESIHRRLLARAENARKMRDNDQQNGFYNDAAQWGNRAEAYEEAAKLVSEIDSFESEEA